MAQPFILGNEATPLAWVPVIQAAAYVTGNCVGAKFQVTDGANVSDIKALIQSIVLTDKDKQNLAIDIVLFNDNPSGSTLTDKAAAVIAAADLPKVIGLAQVTSWTADGIGFVGNLAMPVYVTGGKSLYAVLIARGAATFTSTSSVSVQLNPVPAR
jgi:hypothetical protein